MTLHDAKKILAAQKDCLENQIKSLCDCDCNNCELNYCQGNYGEQVEALDVAISLVEDFTAEYDHEEDDDYCDECGYYGDDCSYDEETGQLVINCGICPHNTMNGEEY